MHNIYDEIETRWCDVYADMHRDSADRSGFHEMLLEMEAEARTKASGFLQPQLGIFEFGIEWLAYVHILLSKSDGLGPVNDEARSAWALVGAAVSFALSIRSLLLNGFDTPAKALLRTYVETLFLCIVILDDRGLAKVYAAAETDDQIKNFWHTFASPKKLHERIIEIEGRVGLENDVIRAMTEWRRQEYEILSQSSHLSYVAAFLTSVSPALGGGEEYVPSFMGLASKYSPRTVFYAAASTWYFSRMVDDKLLGRDSAEALIVLDKENKWHQRYIAGRDTLSIVTLSNWENDASEG